MVQAVLIRHRVRLFRLDPACAWRWLFSLWTPAYASKVKIEKNEPLAVPDLLLEGGRRLTFVRMFATDRDVGGKRGFFNKVLDVVAGAPDRRQMIRPYGDRHRFARTGDGHRPGGDGHPYF